MTTSPALETRNSLASIRHRPVSAPLVAQNEAIPWASGNIPISPAITWPKPSIMHRTEHCYLAQTSWNKSGHMYCHFWQSLPARMEILFLLSIFKLLFRRTECESFSPVYVSGGQLKNRKLLWNLRPVTHKSHWCGWLSQQMGIRHPLLSTCLPSLASYQWHHYRMWTAQGDALGGLDPITGQNCENLWFSNNTIMLHILDG